jgi:hypothetical protein
MRTPKITQTATTLTVSRGKSVVYGIGLATNNAAVNAIFYNGLGTGDPEIMRIYGAAQTSVFHAFPKPIICERGIHIVVSAATAFATVMWDTYREKGE